MNKIIINLIVIWITLSTYHVYATEINGAEKYNKIPVILDVDNDLLNSSNENIYTRSRSLFLSPSIQKIVLPIQIINDKVLSPRSLVYMDNLVEVLNKDKEYKLRIVLNYDDHAKYEHLIKSTLMQKYLIKEQRLSFLKENVHRQENAIGSQIKPNFIEFIFFK